MSSRSDVTERGRWLAASAAVLRASGRMTADHTDAFAKLSRREVGGVVVPALGTRDDVAALPTADALAADPGQAPYLRGSRPSATWDVRARVASADAGAANRAVTDELRGGAKSIWLRVNDDLSAALDGVDLAVTPLVLAGYDASMGDALAALVASRGAQLHPAGSLGVDPIDAAHGVVESAAADVVAAAHVADSLGIGAIVVDGTVVHDLGGSDAQEIGYTLASGAAYLRILTAAGFDIDTACRLISFRYAVTDNQFTQIAKLRAARLAWFRVCELSGATAGAAAMRQHAVTSAAMLTRYDRHTNMLRSTIATFAAAVGGADAITTLPFDHALGEPDGFSRRMARNISALLIGESGLGQVTDPAGGAGAVEMLTAQLGEAGWGEFTAIEAGGGIVSAVADGSLAARIDEVRAERNRRIATRRQPLTGVSEFPDPAEGFPGADLAGGGASARGGSRRWAEPFEDLRDTPPPEPLLLVRIGTEAAAAARVGFATNLLAAGGVSITEAAADDLGDITASAAMLVGADRDYVAQASDVAARLRAAGVTDLFLAGRPKDLDIGATTVAVGDDVLAFLGTVRAALGGDK